MVAEKPRYRVNNDGSFVHVSGEPPTVNVNNLGAFQGQQNFSRWENSIYDGGKFAGGFGPTEIQHVDYWTLRQRSSQLFTENLYARGLIRRLVTNEINTGLCPEATPDEEIIGIEDGSLQDWSETVENRFNIWAQQPLVCDWKQQDTFGELQAAAREEALVAGDVLVVLKQSRQTRLPMVQLVRGESVQSPLSDQDGKLRKGHEVKHGVELNRLGRVVAYWVRQKDGETSRLPAFSERTGRRVAWLVFGTDKRLDDVRGQPLLSLVLQSLKEIDRYRDSAQRKAVVNSILAMFIKKTEDKIGSLPMTGGAVQHGSVATTDADGTPRQYNMAKSIPGVVMEGLQQGEEPVGFHSQGTDINFGTFEAAILQTVAWANEVPPEILTLAFSNNYSASQAAINEFKIYLNKVWATFGSKFCVPVYIEWLLSETLLQNIKASKLLESWRDPQSYDVFGAWTLTEWYGSIKPSTDMFKQAKGSQLAVNEGWSTNARESRALTGTKYSKNIKRLLRENEQKVAALRPLLELKAEFGDVAAVDDAVKALESAHLSLVGDIRNE